MRVGYLDTSCLVAIEFGEKGGRAISRRIKDFDELVSANLLEAERRATFRREGVVEPPGSPAAVSWILPDRPLSPEIGRVLATGYLRGADCWHLAAALYLAQDPSELTFLTLDARQKEVARVLGFRT